MVMVDILTVYGPYNPFKELQIKNLKRYTNKAYIHYTVQGGNNGSRSHGPALDSLMSQGSGEYVVALDSDAFPVDFDWIDFLLEKLKTNIAVGICHQEPLYVHPSFFATKREYLRGLSWARQKDKDVGRVISEDLMKRGPVELLVPSHYFAANPLGDHEPPLGAVYDHYIFHNWYTSRTKNTPNPDGISGKLITDSIRDALERYS